MAKGCGVTGSRVMGGGFGGCTINLVKDELYDSFLEKTLTAYKHEYGIDAKVYDVVIRDGARKISE
jgi:galactokinase